MIDVLLGCGDGTFGNPSAYAAGTSPNNLVITDVNGDGKPDLATNNLSVDTLSLLVGHGDGTFAAPVALPVADSPFGIVAGDFDDDGKSDLATYSTKGAGVSILYGNGDGTFAPYTTIPFNTIQAMSLADFNGDGRSDLVIGTATRGNVPSGTFGTITVLLAGTSRGAFTMLPSVTVPLTFVNMLAAGDIDGDGKPDVAINQTTFDGSNFSQLGFGILHNTGGGVLAAPVQTITNFLSGGIAIRDIDGDGRKDVVMARLYNTIAVALGEANGSLCSVQRYTFGGAGGFDVGDINNDGRPDFVSPLGGELNVDLNLLPSSKPPVITGSSYTVDKHTVSFSFNSAIDPTSAAVNDLEVRNLTTAQTAFSATAVHVSADGKTLSFTLPTTLADGNYRFRLPAGSVRNTGAFATTMALDASGSTFVLAGDADHDRDVDFTDLLTLAKSYGQAGKAYSHGDFNYDGVVDFSDLLILAKNYNVALSAVAAASATVVAAAAARHRVADEVLS